MPETKEKKSKMYEKDLYKPVKEFFTGLGYDVKAEVEDCDVVACRNDEIIIIELKLRLNLEVILQAVLRQRIGEIVYIAVPQNKECRSKRFKNICHLLRRLELGLLLVRTGKNPSVSVLIESEPFDRSKSMQKSRIRQKKLRREFNERHGDLNTGGVSQRKIITSYREKVVHVAGLLQKYGPMSAKQLRQMGADDNTYSFLYNNYYNWFARESKGIYRLTEKGERELSEYSELVELLSGQESVED